MAEAPEDAMEEDALDGASASNSGGEDGDADRDREGSETDGGEEEVAGDEEGSEEEEPQADPRAAVCFYVSAVMCSVGKRVRYGAHTFSHRHTRAVVGSAKPARMRRKELHEPCAVRRPPQAMMARARARRRTRVVAVVAVSERSALRWHPGTVPRVGARASTCVCLCLVCVVELVTRRCALGCFEVSTASCGIGRSMYAPPRTVPVPPRACQCTTGGTESGTRACKEMCNYAHLCACQGTAGCAKRCTIIMTRGY